MLRTGQFYLDRLWLSPAVLHCVRFPLRDLECLPLAEVDPDPRTIHEVLPPMVRLGSHLFATVRTRRRECEPAKKQRPRSARTPQQDEMEIEERKEKKERKEEEGMEEEEQEREQRKEREDQEQGATDSDDSEEEEEEDEEVPTPTYHLVAIKMHSLLTGHLSTTMGCALLGPGGIPDHGGGGCVPGGGVCSHQLAVLEQCCAGELRYCHPLDGERLLWAMSHLPADGLAHAVNTVNAKESPLGNLQDAEAVLVGPAGSPHMGSTRPNAEI
jgi:hypothetical protein